MSKTYNSPNQLSLLDWDPGEYVGGLLTADEIFALTDSKRLAALQESHNFEKKGSQVKPEILAQCLSAFGNSSNTIGGVVAIGIEDDGKISGCSSLSENNLSEIEGMGRDRCPEGKFKTRRVEVLNARGQRDFIILARVYYAEDKLIELTNGDAYFRQTNKNLKLSDSEKQEIRINKGEVSFEQQKSNLVYPQDFKSSEIAAFLTELRDMHGISNETKDEQILEMFHLGKRQQDGSFQPNHACALLFANDPTTEFPGCMIHFLRYEGNKELSGTEYNVVKDIMIPGTILDQIKEVKKLVSANLREFTIFDQKGKFRTVPEYPQDAWYELIVNACAHRSYSIRNAPIFVKMFDDHLEVVSPGGFMPQVNPQTIYEMHRPRNPFIMRVLREEGEVRCINEGTKRVRKEMADAQLPPPVFKQDSLQHFSVSASLKNNIHNRKNSLDSEAYKMLGAAMAGMLNDDERKIINYVLQKTFINVSQALRIISSTRWHTAKDLLEGLRQKGILTFQQKGGERSPGRYFLRKV